VLVGFARQFKSLSLPKFGSGYRAGYCLGLYCFGLTSLLLLAGAGSVHDAAALNETRTLSFHHTHSNEDLTVTFKRDGRYDEEALKQLNHYLRDWRTQDQTVMDRHLFDILWEVYRDVDGKKPIQIISSYRSPATNAMLRRRSTGVARFSQHMLGHAMDFFIPDVPLEQIRFAGLRLQRGGVGFYPTSGSPFVHLDTGSIRHWPRMTHDQLARVFPDGRTVHVPTDGKPLKGFELARADIEKRDGDDSAMTKNSPTLWSALFKRKSSDDDDEADAPAPAAASVAPVKSADAKAVDLKIADSKPVDSKPLDSKPADIKSADAASTSRAKPRAGATLQLASADMQVAQVAKPKQDTPVEPSGQTVADVINARGFWGDNSATPKQATPAQIAALKARQSVDPQATASISSAMQAMAYAPAAAPAVDRPAVDRATIVAASAPMPRSARPAPRNAAAATEINTVAAKDTPVQVAGQSGVVSTSTRISAAKGNGIWLRVVMLAPSASSSMFTTVLGDTDMTLMRGYFIKPQTAVAMSFSDDPMMGMSIDHFSGSSATPLTTTSFVVQTASLH
jgi:uncharacterized protein YcbK (DUF882 family)